MTWAEYNSPTKCRSCGAPITWGLTKNGRRCPFNEDGTSHFGTCPQAKRWTKPKVDHVLSEARKGSNGHTCHADGCQAKVPPAMFMCKRHWFMVPIGLRNRVWELYGGSGIEGTGRAVRKGIAAMSDVVVTVPKGLWEEWLEEGDKASPNGPEPRDGLAEYVDAE